MFFYINLILPLLCVVLWIVLCFLFGLKLRLFMPIFQWNNLHGTASLFFFWIVLMEMSLYSNWLSNAPWIICIKVKIVTTGPSPCFSGSWCCSFMDSPTPPSPLYPSCKLFYGLRTKTDNIFSLKALLFTPQTCVIRLKFAWLAVWCMWIN